MKATLDDLRLPAAELVAPAPAVSSKAAWLLPLCILLAAIAVRVYPTAGFKGVSLDEALYRLYLIKLDKGGLAGYPVLCDPTSKISATPRRSRSSRPPAFFTSSPAGFGNARSSATLRRCLRARRARGERPRAALAAPRGVSFQHSRRRGGRALRVSHARAGSDARGARALRLHAHADSHGPARAHRRVLRVLGDDVPVDALGEPAPSERRAPARRVGVLPGADGDDEGELVLRLRRAGRVGSGESLGEVWHGHAAAHRRGNRRAARGRAACSSHWRAAWRRSWRYTGCS